MDKLDEQRNEWTDRWIKPNYLAMLPTEATTQFLLKRIPFKKDEVM